MARHHPAVRAAVMSARDEGHERIALVTGGASGIGLATAGVLRQRNWRVVIADINAERSQAAAAQLGDRKSTRLNSSHALTSRMPSSA